MPFNRLQWTLTMVSYFCLCISPARLTPSVFWISEPADTYKTHNVTSFMSPLFLSKQHPFLSAFQSFEWSDHVSSLWFQWSCNLDPILKLPVRIKRCLLSADFTTLLSLLCQYLRLMHYSLVFSVALWQKAFFFFICCGVCVSIYWSCDFESLYIVLFLKHHAIGKKERFFEAQTLFYSFCGYWRLGHYSEVFQLSICSQE